MMTGSSSIARQLSLILVAASGLAPLATGAALSAQAGELTERTTGPEPLPPLPAPAPDAAEAALAPEAWRASEIADARRACEAIAAETAARFEILPPRRKGACGAPAPIRLEAIGQQDPVRFVPAPVVSCDMVVALTRWIEKGLKPLGERHLDGAVSEVRVMSSYSCRTRYGKTGARMSEHAFANALDIAGFAFADGRTVDVLSGWGATRRDLLAAAARPVGPAQAAEASRTAVETANALPPIPMRRPLKQAVIAAAAPRAAVKPVRNTTRKIPAANSKPRETPRRITARARPSSGPQRDATRFLRESHRLACAIFGTTLGPEANDAHRNHFHVDMFPRRNRGYCE
jgi:hypothetical protein